MNKQYRLKADYRFAVSNESFTMKAGSTVTVEKVDEARRKLLIRFDGRTVDWFHNSIMSYLEPLAEVEASKPPLYRGGWNIQPSYIGYQWSHVDYDGPEDRRIGQCKTVEECEREIDDWLITVAMTELEKENARLQAEIDALKERAQCTVTINSRSVLSRRCKDIRVGAKYSELVVSFPGKRFKFVSPVVVETPCESIDYQAVERVDGEVSVVLLPQSYCHQSQSFDEKGGLVHRCESETC